MRVGVVLNPTSRGAARIAGLVASACAARGWPAPDIRTTTVADPGTGQARELAASGAQVVLAAGGDGTVRCVAHGLLPLRPGDASPALGVVPLGTANLLAHGLRLVVGDPSRAIDVALDGRDRPLDLGLARIGEEVSEHPFVVLSGIGRDAAAVAATRTELKRRLGWLAYAVPGLTQALRPPVEMAVSLDGEPPRALHAWSVLAANLGEVRARVQIAPQARIDDGLLQVLEVSVRHPGQWLPIAAKGVLARPGDVPGLRTVPAREVEVTSEVALPVQVDGDVLGPTRRVRLLVLPRAVRVRT